MRESERGRGRESEEECEREREGGRVREDVLYQYLAVVLTCLSHVEVMDEGAIIVMTNDILVSH